MLYAVDRLQVVIRHQEGGHCDAGRTSRPSDEDHAQCIERLNAMMWQHGKETGGIGGWKGLEGTEPIAWKDFR